MSAAKDLRRDPQGAIFDHLDDLRAGLLGVIGAEQHMQPMHHYPDREAKVLWFITSSRTDLAQAIGDGAVGAGAQARFTITGKDQDFWAAMTGPIARVADAAKLDELWSPVAAAWFDKGREDPEVTLLRMELREAAVWAATGNPLRFGIEIARANMDEERKPDIGEHMVVSF